MFIYYLPYRFYRKRKDKYMVSYNPCSSFTFGTKLGDCTDDVAVSICDSGRMLRHSAYQFPKLNNS